MEFKKIFICTFKSVVDKWDSESVYHGIIQNKTRLLRKSTPSFTKSSSLVLIGLILILLRNTVKPVYNGPVYSGHPVYYGHLTTSTKLLIALYFLQS